MVSIDNIPSIINDSSEVFDSERPFTFIEFIKLFEYSKENDGEFFDAFTSYLHAWASYKKDTETKDIDSFVQSQLFDLLKTITLSYSSYEEQRFLSNINLDDRHQVKQVIPIYAKRILDICNFYRKKRQGVRGIIRRNSFKGSVQSIEEVVYNKIIDWMFNNKNIPIAYKEIRNNLSVSIENYVDTYSEYFDIPRDEELQDKVRYNYDMLTSNMNTVDYRYFVAVSEVVSGALYGGKVYLKEIPLIAQLALDLGQDCVGDLLAMKNSLSYKATINRIDLDEQIAIKRDLYKKFIGCDLYYAYMDKDRNIITDVLCKADNPTGNLLNCCSADAAVQPSYQLKELAKIGLFFKPDKCTILKVNARDYTWQFDADNMTEESWYIFPDPNKYGDIGNNKSADYPLVMTYKDTYDIRNLSSGEVRDYPLVFLGDQNWRAYYSKSDDEFIQFDNGKFDYQFTKKIQGFEFREENGKRKVGFHYPLENYQMDMFGNQFALIQTETDLGTQTIELFDRDTTENYQTAILITLSDQAMRVGNISFSYAVNEEENIVIPLKEKTTVITLERIFGETYTYTFDILSHNVSILDEPLSKTHMRDLPQSNIVMVPEYKAITYKLKPNFNFTFTDTTSEERYSPVKPTIMFIDANGEQDNMSLEDWQNQSFSYDTDYNYNVTATFDTFVSGGQYNKAFEENVTPDGVFNTIKVNMGNISFNIKSAVQYVYDFNAHNIYDGDEQPSTRLHSIDGMYSKETPIMEVDISKQITTSSVDE